MDGNRIHRVLRMLHLNQTTDTDQTQRCNYITVVTFQNSSSLWTTRDWNRPRRATPYDSEGDILYDDWIPRTKLIWWRRHVGDKVGRNEIRENEGEWRKKLGEGEERVLEKREERVAMGGKDKERWKERKQKWKTIQEDNKEMKIDEPSTAAKIPRPL
jgi:hypothetical protein